MSRVLATLPQSWWTHKREPHILQNLTDLFAVEMLAPGAFSRLNIKVGCYVAFSERSVLSTQRHRLRSVFRIAELMI